MQQNPIKLHFTSVDRQGTGHLSKSFWFLSCDDLRQALLEPERSVRPNFSPQSAFEPLFLPSASERGSPVHTPPPLKHRYRRDTSKHPRELTSNLLFNFLGRVQPVLKEKQQYDLNQRRVWWLSIEPYTHCTEREPSGEGPLHCGSFHTPGGLLSSPVWAQTLNMETRAFIINGWLNFSPGKSQMLNDEVWRWLSLQ